MITQIKSLKIIISIKNYANYTIIKKITLLIGFLLFSACSTYRNTSGSQTKIANFSSDGCTNAPNGFENKTSLLQCCFNHDIAYWIGGTEQDRMNADQTLRQCISKKEGEALANAYFNAVRLFGRPNTNFSYRWGYGWPYGFGYRKLTTQQVNSVKTKWNLFLKTHSQLQK